MKTINQISGNGKSKEIKVNTTIKKADYKRHGKIITEAEYIPYIIALNGENVFSSEKYYKLILLVTSLTDNIPYKVSLVYGSGEDEKIVNIGSGITGKRNIIYFKGDGFSSKIEVIKEEQDEDMDVSSGIPQVEINKNTGATLYEYQNLLGEYSSSVFEQLYIEAPLGNKFLIDGEEIQVYNTHDNINYGSYILHEKMQVNSISCIDAPLIMTYYINFVTED